MDLKTPELEKIIVANLHLEDINYKSITRLRVANISEDGLQYLVIAPDNYSGKLGFTAHLVNTDLIHLEVIAPGVTIFDLADGTEVFIHTTKKTWPKNLAYQKIDIGDYYFSIGEYHAIRERQQKKK